MCRVQTSSWSISFCCSFSNFNGNREQGGIDIFNVQLQISKLFLCFLRGPCLRYKQVFTRRVGQLHQYQGEHDGRRGRVGLRSAFSIQCCDWSNCQGVTTCYQIDQSQHWIERTKNQVSLSPLTVSLKISLLDSMLWLVELSGCDSTLPDWPITALNREGWKLSFSFSSYGFLDKILHWT